MTKPVSSRKVTLDDLSKTVAYIARSVELSQPRLILRAVRIHSYVRKFIDGPVLHGAVHKYFPVNWSGIEQVYNTISKIPAALAAVEIGTDTAMDVVSSEESLRPTTSLPPPLSAAVDILPEVEVFLLSLVLTTLLRHDMNVEAAEFSSLLIGRIRSFNRRSLDVLASKAYFYFSLAFEKINRLENIRSTLLALYRTACLHRDEMSQAVLINLILRNYMSYNLIEQAQALAAKTTFPESASNNQYCRYLYYMGRLQAIQLDYSDSYMKLMMSARKAPQDVAPGFRRTVHKLAIIVQLLMGEIPERSLFNQEDMRVSLRPYLGLTQAVRAGDVKEFESFVQSHADVFKADNNFSLVQRLGHNVLKTGLRKISLSYVRISLQDIADKLHLPSAKSAEYVCAKAIRDHVIEATINHEESCMISSEVSDLYRTQEPQKQFHKRIVFCLDVHNEAVKAMRYPPAKSSGVVGASDDQKDGDKDKKKKGDDGDKTIDEIIKEIEDEMDDM